MSDLHVVVNDPSGEYWDGSIVNGATRAVLEARHVVCLPVLPDLFRRSALAGFFKRSWGAGWPLGTPAPRFHAPLAIMASHDLYSLHWAARLVPDDPSVKIYPGLLRFAADSSQTGGFAGGFTPMHGCNIEVQSLGDVDEDGGWNISGMGHISVTGDSIFTCGLYGTVPGLRVAWAAVTQTA